MTTIRILKPEDVTLPESLIVEVDREEAEANFNRAIAATENLKEFVNNRDQQMFPESDIRASNSRIRRIGFMKW